jgi:hypothetical protein
MSSEMIPLGPFFLPSAEMVPLNDLLVGGFNPSEKY